MRSLSNDPIHSICILKSIILGMLYFLLASFSIVSLEFINTRAKKLKDITTFLKWLFPLHYLTSIYLDILIYFERKNPGNRNHVLVSYELSFPFIFSPLFSSHSLWNLPLLAHALYTKGTVNGCPLQK